MKKATKPSPEVNKGAAIRSEVFEKYLARRIKNAENTVEKEVLESVIKWVKGAAKRAVKVPGGTGGRK